MSARAVACSPRCSETSPAFGRSSIRTSRACSSSATMASSITSPASGSTAGRCARCFTPLARASRGRRSRRHRAGDRVRARLCARARDRARRRARGERHRHDGPPVRADELPRQTHGRGRGGAAAGYRRRAWPRAARGGALYGRSVGAGCTRPAHGTVPAARLNAIRAVLEKPASRRTGTVAEFLTPPASHSRAPAPRRAARRDH